MLLETVSGHTDKMHYDYKFQYYLMWMHGIRPHWNSVVYILDVPG